MMKKYYLLPIRTRIANVIMTVAMITTRNCNTTVEETTFATTIMDKTYGTEYRKQAKLDRNRKLLITASA